MPDRLCQRFGAGLGRWCYALICLIKGALGKLCDINFTAISAYGGKECEEYSNVLQITVDESPISGLQVGAVSAPGNIACK